MSSPDDLVKAYLDLCEAEKSIAGEKQILKDQLSAALNIGIDPEPGQFWNFDQVGRVEVCKGRTTVKLDRAKLVRQGVTAEILDAATSKDTGNPSIRITPLKEEK